MSEQKNNQIDTNCAYCMEGDLVAAFGIKICELETSKLYLFKEQSHPGRVIVAHKKHVGDMTELTDEERNAYFADIAKVSRALQRAFRRSITARTAIPDGICISIWSRNIKTDTNGAEFLR